MDIPLRNKCTAEAGRGATLDDWKKCAQSGFRDLDLRRQQQVLCQAMPHRVPGSGWRMTRNKRDILGRVRVVLFTLECSAQTFYLFALCAALPACVFLLQLAYAH